MTIPHVEGKEHELRAQGDDLYKSSQNHSNWGYSFIKPQSKFFLKTTSFGVIFVSKKISKFSPFDSVPGCHHPLAG
jgi:hypothetical protein